MSTERGCRESKFFTYIKGHIKILGRARDFYVHSLTGCAGHVTYGNAMGCPTPHLASQPGSLSSNIYSCRDDDFRELIRVASTRSLTGKTKAELLRQKASSLEAVPRSRTITSGRIDEDEPCESNVGERPPEFFPRSRSYAASTRSNVMM